jgi:hypothetical protein
MKGPIPSHSFKKKTGAGSVPRPPNTTVSISPPGKAARGDTARLDGDGRNRVHGFKGSPKGHTAKGSFKPPKEMPKAL